MCLQIVNLDDTCRITGLLYRHLYTPGYRGDHSYNILVASAGFSSLSVAAPIIHSYTVAAPIIYSYTVAAPIIYSYTVAAPIIYSYSEQHL